MKKSILLLSTSLAVAIGGFIFLNDDTENEPVKRSYHLAELNQNAAKSQNWNDAYEIYHQLYADVNTGEIDHEQLRLAKQQVLQIMMQKAGAFTFVDEGPDNVGGRTRGIAIDPSDDNNIYAGSVSGGLFRSINAGGSWERVQSFDDAVNNAASGNGSVSISSIAITKNGNIYVGTGGSIYEGSLSGEGSGTQDGDGIWYSEDDGATFQQITGTNGTDINKVVADTNQNDLIYYVGISQGLKKVEDLGTPTSVTTSISGTTLDVKVSGDGQVIIVGLAQGAQKSFVSQDGGNTWTDLHGDGKLVGSGMSRVEYGISHEKDAAGNYHLYAVFANSASKLGGVHRSLDNGANWCQIAPASTPGFEPLTSRSGQGYYDLVISAIPGQNACILGGIDLWKWEETPGGSCDNGEWQVISNWALNPSNPQYIHADNHRITWNSQGRMYVGNDGGVQMSFGPQVGLFSVVNKGYNITQFYGIAYGGDGAVMGGTQDNGTQYNDHTGIGPLEFREIRGGDGFECEISYLSSAALIATVYNGDIARSDDRGLNWQDQAAPCPGTPGLDCGPFYNSIRLFEDGNDLNTQDSVQYIPDTSYSIGDVVTYYSESFGIPMQYTLTQNLTVTYESVTPQTDSILPNFDTIFAGETYYFNPVAQDTIMLPDYKQSLFATQGDANIYVTRDMMRFGVTPEWWNLFPLGTGIMNSSARSYDFSKDGNWLWVGSTNGELVRVSGLDSAYSQAAADYSSRPADTDTLILISNGDTVTGSALDNINFNVDGHLYSNLDGSAVGYQLHVQKVTSPSTFSGVITDISVDPADPNKVCVTRGGTSGSQVWYSTNATSSNPTFSSIDGNLPNMPVFGCVVERDPSTDVIILGTEYGVFSTDNPNAGTVTWTAHNEELGPVPVFDVRQQWRDWEDGIDSSKRYQMVNNPGAIYLGTHGRGIWRSDDVLNIGEIKPIEASNELVIDYLNVFPNPASDEVNVSFELSKRTDVIFKIYDLQGKIMKNITWNNMSSGVHTMNFDCTKFPVGTYFATIESMDVNKVAKFVKY